MARRRRSDNRSQRDTNDIASPLLDRAKLLNSEAFRAAFVDPDLREWEDGRTFHPDGVFRPAGVRRSRFARQLFATDSAYSRQAVAFAVPKQVAVCVRRKQRREVLFAKRRMKGRGGTRRYTERSHIKC